MTDTPSKAISQQPRYINKAVLRVKGGSRGVLYTLYLRLSFPSSAQTETFRLVPDEHVRLRSSAVYNALVEDNGKIHVPSGSTETFKRAAKMLGSGILETAARVR